MSWFQSAMTMSGERPRQDSARLPDEVVAVDGVVVGVEHVGPDDDAAAGVEFFESGDAGAGVAGEEVPGGELTVLAGGAVVEDTDFIVGHEVGFRVP